MGIGNGIVFSHVCLWTNAMYEYAVYVSNEKRLHSWRLLQGAKGVTISYSFHMPMFDVALL